MLFWIFSMTGYVCAVFMNVNLSMCKQPVFKHVGMAMGRVWIGYTHIRPEKFTRGYPIINTR